MKRRRNEGKNKNVKKCRHSFIIVYAFAANVYFTTDNDKGNLVKDCIDRAVKTLLSSFRR